MSLQSKTKPSRKTKAVREIAHPRDSLELLGSDDEFAEFQITGTKGWLAVFPKKDPVDIDPSERDFGYYHKHQTGKVQVPPKHISEGSGILLKCSKCGAELLLDWDHSPSVEVG
jgi:hypothetical protein